MRLGAKCRGSFSAGKSIPTTGDAAPSITSACPRHHEGLSLGKELTIKTTTQAAKPSNLAAGHVQEGGSSACSRGSWQ